MFDNDTDFVVYYFIAVFYQLWVSMPTEPKKGLKLITVLKIYDILRHKILLRVQEIFGKREISFWGLLTLHKVSLSLFIDVHLKR